METRPTTIRFGPVIYQRLEGASVVTGLPINALVTVACLEWLERHPTEALSGPPRALGVRGFIARLRGALGDRFDTFSPDAKQALQRAAAEARLGGQPTITAEQVLLAAATEPDAPAARALAALGFDADLLRARAEPVLGRRGQRNAPPAAGPGLALDAGAKRLIEAAVAVENQRHDGHVGAEHLLLGALELAERSPSVGRALLTAWDVDPAALRTAIEQQLPV